MNYTFSDRMNSLQPSAIREILKFTADPKVISFAAGNPAPEAFPAKEIAAISAELLEKNPVGALQYSVTEGYGPLRELTAKFACRKETLMRENDQLIMVSGAQQGIELTTKCLCNEGDTIICEDPSFIGSLNTFRSYRQKLVGVPLEADGMNIEALEKALQENPNTRFIYIIPNFQNPTGITTTMEKRRQVYDLAVKYGVMIMEDNPYGDLRFDGQHVPSIKSIDTEGIVVYCGSFSKLISPGMRVGYVIAPAQVVAKLVVAKQCSDVHTNIWSQMVCAGLLETLDMDNYIAGLCKVYQRKAKLMLSQMDQHFSSKLNWTKPQGGLFIWCTLPEGADMLGFCKNSVENRVAVVPGSAFTAIEGAPTQSFRLNYSTPSDEKIIEGIELLGKMTHTL